MKAIFTIDASPANIRPMRIAFRHCLAVTTLAFGAPAALAQQAPEASHAASLRESIQRVESQTGGEVLRAHSQPWNGRQVNRVKVLMPEGRVRVVTDDPRRRGQRDEPLGSRSRDD